MIQTIPGRLERLVRFQQLLLVAVKFRIIENLPPRSFCEGVFRCGLAPWALGFPCRWCLDRRTLVLGTHRAARQAQACPERESCEPLHDCFPCGLSGATFTVWPSSRESAGLTMMRSSTPTPPRISKVVP